MDAKVFVGNWKKEKDNFLNLYMSNDDEVKAVSKIKEMNLNDNQVNILNDVLNNVLNDVFYTLLMGLDGSATIGDGMQESFKIYDEEGHLISSNGEIETEAYEQFMETE